MRDGTSHTVLIAEQSGASAACADADGDGTVGMVSWSLLGRNPQSGERIPVSFAAATGDVDGRGGHLVRMEIGSRVVTGVIDVARFDLNPSGDDPPSRADRD